MENNGDGKEVNKNLQHHGRMNETEVSSYIATYVHVASKAIFPAHKK